MQLDQFKVPVYCLPRKLPELAGVASAELREKREGEDGRGEGGTGRGMLLHMIAY